MPARSEWCHCVSRRSRCPSSTAGPLCGMNQGAGDESSTPPLLLFLAGRSPSHRVRSHCAGSRPGCRLSTRRMQKGGKTSTQAQQRRSEPGRRGWHFQCCRTRSLPCSAQNQTPTLIWRSVFFFFYLYPYCRVKCLRCRSDGELSGGASATPGSKASRCCTLCRRVVLSLASLRCLV